MSPEAHCWAQCPGDGYPTLQKRPFEGSKPVPSIHMADTTHRSGCPSPGTRGPRCQRENTRPHLRHWSPGFLENPSVPWGPPPSWLQSAPLHPHPGKPASGSPAPPPAWGEARGRGRLRGSWTETSLLAFSDYQLGYAGHTGLLAPNIPVYPFSSQETRPNSWWAMRRGEYSAGLQKGRKKEMAEAGHSSRRQLPG